MRERERVSLWIRIRTTEGKRPYCRPVPKKNGWAIVNGQKECHLQDGVYHLRYEIDGKRIWQAVGTSYLAAEARRKIRDGELALNQGSAAPKTPARVTLTEQKDKFMELKRLTKKRDGTRLDKETITAYEQQVTEFLLVAKKTFASEITGMDLRRYMAALEKRGLTHRTICNNYTSVATFLKFCGIDHKELLPQEERPRPDDGVPEAYTETEVQRFFAALIEERHHLAFETLLKTGLREREMTTLEPSDFVFGENPTVTVQARKPYLNFRCKTGKSRTIPLEKGLAFKWRRG